MYRRPDDSEAPSPDDVNRSEGKVVDGRKWTGYNPAVEARWITQADLDRVKSPSKPSRKMVEGRKPYSGEQSRL
jgi:hypothetical protein